MSKKIIIIGGVAGGASCAARLRRLDKEVDILLLERGNYVSYANCGLPYFIGGVISQREALLLQTPEGLKERFAIDVRVNSEVIRIDRLGKQVYIKDVVSGEIYQEHYDRLVLATGSQPVVPSIPGIDSPRIEQLWTVPDAERITQELSSGENAKNIAVIGGGFIGLEMVENLRAKGHHLHLIEAQDQVMAPLDYEMAQLLHENLKRYGVQLHLSNGVTAFEDQGEQILVQLQDGNSLSVDFVILSIGVKPNGDLAKEAGLEVNARGGVITDAYLRTSDPFIYAVGDLIQVKDFTFMEPAMIPLAGPANKQGRIAADNLAGRKVTYKASQGTAIAKVFDLTVASTGVNEKSLQKRGYLKDKDYKSITVLQFSHASYYPKAMPMTIKLLFSADGRKIFGAQIIGRDGVDKRMDVLATAIRLGASIEELTQLELSYAPPYGSAKDPVNMLGFAAENVLTGLVRFADWDVVEKEPNTVFLDVREDVERLRYAIPGAIGIPLGQLRNHLHELDKNKPLVVFCAIGVRAYNGARILMQNGFKDVRIYPSGASFYRSTHN